MKVQALFGGLILAISSFSFAGPGLWSGNQLVPYYLSFESVTSGRGSDRDIANMALYLGYVRGTYEILATMSGNVICVDNSVTVEQIARVVGRYMRENPHELNQAALAIVGASLKSAFPCR